MTKCAICEAEIPDDTENKIAECLFCAACWHLFFEEHDQPQAEPITEVEGGEQ